MSKPEPHEQALIAALRREMLNGPDDALAERVKTRLGQSLALGAAAAATSAVAKPAAAATKTAAALGAGSAAPLAASSAATIAGGGAAATATLHPVLAFVGAMALGSGLTLGISAATSSDGKPAAALSASAPPASPAAPRTPAAPRATRAADAPSSDAPSSDAPSSDAPSSDAPSSDAPNSDAPSASGENDADAVQQRRSAAPPAESASAVHEAQARAVAIAETSSLAQQQILLDTARRALARGDASAALEALAWHRSRYPQTELAQEREALAIKSLRAAGRGGESNAAAKRFAERYPRSVFLPGLSDSEANSVTDTPSKAQDDQ